MFVIGKDKDVLPLTGDEVAGAEEKQWTVIDRSLNYGRHQIKRFLLSAGPYRTVIDLGAGQGDDLMLARSINIQADIHAVEVYPVYAARLSEKGIRVHNLNIEKDPLPFQDGAVDVVIANQVLEHVKELFWIFHEITRVLPIGGKMILGVPNLASLHNRILLAFGRQPSPLKNNSAHIRGYTKSDLLKFLESCFPGGFKLMQYGGSNFYPFPPVVARPLAKLFPNMAWGIFFLFEKQRAYKNEFLDFPVKEKLETNFYVGK
jgi:SAM-dependent methyltransferase